VLASGARLTQARLEPVSRPRVALAVAAIAALGTAGYMFTLSPGTHTNLTAEAISPRQPARPDHLTAGGLFARVAPKLPAKPSPVTEFTTTQGEYLSVLAAKYLGSESDWPALYMANEKVIGSNPSVLNAGLVLHIPGTQSIPELLSEWKEWNAEYPAPASSPERPQAPPELAVQTGASAPPGGNVLTAAEVGQLWINAGGPADQENNAICIARAESGFRTNAISPSDDAGIWQINASNAPTEEMLNPSANAAEAVHLFDADGWSPWTTRGMCGI
jgi:hypothetical protein